MSEGGLLASCELDLAYGRRSAGLHITRNGHTAFEQRDDDIVRPAVHVEHRAQRTHFATPDTHDERTRGIFRDLELRLPFQQG